MVWYSHLFKNFLQFVVIHASKLKVLAYLVKQNLMFSPEIFLLLLILLLFFFFFLIIQKILAVLSLVPLPFLILAYTPRNSWFMYC